MKLVVDTSVVAKWLFSEENSQEARQLLVPRFMLHAPDFIQIELANVIWKKVRRKEIESAQPHLEELACLGDAVDLTPSNRLVMKAAELAIRIGHPFYDCLYIACAEVEQAPLITADQALCRRAAKSYPDVEAWHMGGEELALQIKL